TLHNEGVSVPDICKKFPIHRSTIYRTIQNLSRNPDFYANKPKTGRPCVLQDHDLRHASLLLARQEARNYVQRKAFPQVAAQTMHHNLAKIGLKGYVHRQKPFLSVAH
ncbi:hypothetical protein BC835DRAFT_1222137, partial [Cytidiella melzeri]